MIKVVLGDQLFEKIILIKNNKNGNFVWVWIKRYLIPKYGAFLKQSNSRKKDNKSIRVMSS